MALCDFVINSSIVGNDCNNPAVKGAESSGLLINRADIDYSSARYPVTDHPFIVQFGLKCGGKRAYTITQSGKQPFNGTQQEMAEGTYQNTMTNTVQFTILKQDSDTAAQLFALLNGEFVALIPDKAGSSYVQIYGWEAGLHCSGAVRELYNDDTLAGWQVTMTEEGATLGSIFAPKQVYDSLKTATSPCE